MSQTPIILYVDDEPLNLELFKLSFQGKFPILLAKDGQAGLNMLKENPEISVVISDMKMPGMNGIEFIKKAQTVFPDIRYYILTGFEINDEIQDAINTKLIRDCFSKPFVSYEIEMVIRNGR